MIVADQKGVRPIDILNEKLANINDKQPNDDATKTAAAGADAGAANSNDKKVDDSPKRYRQIAAYIERYLDE